MAGRPAKILTKEDILRAQKVTRSNMAASRFLHVSYNHYKKYAKMYKNDEGVTLLEAHMNQSGEGIPKYTAEKEIPLDDLLNGLVPIEHFDPRKVKARIVSEAKMVEVCNKCNFSERRVTDQKVPVILNFKDGNKKNWRLENLEFLCYNCSFLYAASPISENQAEAMEDFGRQEEEPTWELDDWQLEHLNSSMGIKEDKSSLGDEFVSYK